MLKKERESTEQIRQLQASVIDYTNKNEKLDWQFKSKEQESRTVLNTLNSEHFKEVMLLEDKVKALEEKMPLLAE